MNNRVNYTLVGGFVLTGLVLVVIFVYWLINPADEEQMRPYKIFFTESVSGLNLDSPVKYRGISVGKVEEMLINPDNSEEIQVNILIRRRTPIKTDTVAKLEAQGITGLSFIDLSEGSKDAPYLAPEKGEEVAVIPSIPSFFERVGRSLGSVSSQLSQTLSRTEQLLNEKNQERFSVILEHTARTMGQVEKMFDDKAVEDYHRLLAASASASQKIDTLLPKVDTLLASASSGSQKIDAMLPKVDGFIDESIAFEQSVKASFASIMISYKEVEAAMAVFKEKNENGHYSVKDSVHAPMKQFEISMRELQQTLGNINAMLEAYANSPSDLLFKHEESSIGPGEK